MAVLDDYRLKIKDSEYIPIVIGGMGVDISTAELALEACRLGGIGHISDAMNLFVSDKHFATRYTAEKARNNSSSKDTLDKSGVKFNPEHIYQAQKQYVSSVISRKKGDGAVFINTMEKLTMGAPAETLKARLEGALDGGIDGITLSAGLHSGSFKLIAEHPRFSEAYLGIVVSSARALKIFLRSAQRVNRLPDYIVVEGPLAGGHLGFGDDWEEHSLERIVVEVRDFLDKSELDIPVIAAGGVFTGTDAVRMIELGASAVQVATRFTITRECGLPEKVKQEYLQADEQDVTVSDVSPTGYPLRMLKNSPCLDSNQKPMCEPFGYALSKDGACQYLDAYEKGSQNGGVKGKICLCHHFSKHNCYTCGHYVYRLKDTTTKLESGEYYLPSAEHVFKDYQYSSNNQINVAQGCA